MSWDPSLMQPWLWVSADSGAYKDAGVTLCVNGDTVYQWNNRATVTPAPNLIQTVAGDRPTYTTGGQNGQPYISFPNKFLLCSSALAQPFTIIAVFRAQSLPGRICVIVGNSADFDYVSWNAAAGNAPRMVFGSGINGTIAASSVSAQIWSFAVSGASSNFRCTGTNDGGAVNPGAGGFAAAFRVGDYTGAYGNSAPIDLYELLIVKYVIGVEGQKRAYEDYLANKYGITLGYSWGTTDENAAATRGHIGYLQALNIGGVVDTYGVSPIGRAFQVGVRKSTSEGSPAQPSLALDIPGMWRFRWGVTAGTRTISIKAKQVSNVAGRRPRMTVKANPGIGVNADVSGDAGGSADWVTIGPLTVTPASDGVLWVELWNMDAVTFDSPAFFDHITAT